MYGFFNEISVCGVQEKYWCGMCTNMQMTKCNTIWLLWRIGYIFKIVKWCAQNIALKCLWYANGMLCSLATEYNRAEC